MAEKFEETAIIIRQEEIADDIYSMWLHTDQIAAHAKAGQFVSVYCNDGSRLLPRPISICEIDKKDGAIRLVYRVAGKRNGRIFWYAYRRTASYCRASWKRIPKEREKSLFDRRRNRIPPMLQLAKELNCEKQIVLGFRDELFLMDEFKKQGRVYVATEDGSAGTEGNVLDAIRENGLDAEIIYACGPMPMLRALKRICREKSHRVLDLHGGAYGMRYWCVPCLCMSVKRKRRTQQREEQTNL